MASTPEKAPVDIAIANAVLNSDVVLTEGDKGYSVSAMKNIVYASLNEKGDKKYESTSSTYDADFTAAVKQFQSEHGIPETGHIGNLTKKAIEFELEQLQQQNLIQNAKLIKTGNDQSESFTYPNNEKTDVDALKTKVENIATGRRIAALDAAKDILASVGVTAAPKTGAATTASAPAKEHGIA